MNYDAVMDAIEFLKLEIFVDIKFVKGGNNYYTRSVGTIRRRENKVQGFTHTICVAHNLSRSEANITLWHELRHAFQAEKWAAESKRPIQDEFQNNYLPNKRFMEHDAEEFAQRMHQQGHILLN